MSQTPSLEEDPSSDTEAPDQEPMSTQEVPDVSTEAASTLENFEHPQSTEETTSDNSAKADTATVSEQSERVAGEQEVICDQPVSLGPDTEEEVEEQRSAQETDKSWVGWSSWGKSILSSATST
ncbi:protein Noxp20-like, partial [Boleophthalmus pectinirostris]|uniref:protein Noxp20-like n=1 Tax=Boleophthalmus pectinirostris TaxID=150288 RepID=UPI00242A8BC0